MKKLFDLAARIMHSPFTNLIVAVMLIYGGGSEIYEDYVGPKSKLTAHHGIAIYGIFMFIKAAIAIVKMIHGMGRIRGIMGGKNDT